MITFDPERLRERIAELEQELGAPGFWDDQQRAARVSAEHARLTRRLERYERLSRDYEDALVDTIPRPQQRVVAEAEKLGRNDPCWCGSGKKFKRCHGA